MNICFGWFVSACVRFFVAPAVFCAYFILAYAVKVYWFCHPNSSHNEPCGWVQLHDSIQFAQKPVKLDFNLKLLVCKGLKLISVSSAIWKAAALANDLHSSVAKISWYVYIYILCSVCPRVYRSVANLSQTVSAYIVASSLWATMMIFEAHAHACGPGFISISSNQSSVHFFPHKPFWHTRIAYIQP